MYLERYHGINVGSSGIWSSFPGALQPSGGRSSESISSAPGAGRAMPG